MSVPQIHDSVDVAADFGWTTRRLGSNVGVNFLGPIFCKAECRGAGTNPANAKVYVSLFTCLRSQVIHCKIVRGCSVPAFLLAFLQFVTLKNKPNCFYSDVLTFVFANKKLKALLGKGMDPLLLG